MFDYRLLGLGCSISLVNDQSSLKEQMLYNLAPSHMHQFDSTELETMASGIVNAIRKYAIAVEQLTDQQIWEELQNKGYRFPVGATEWDTPYRTDIIEVEVDSWFEALHLALKRARSQSS